MLIYGTIEGAPLPTLKEGGLAMADLARSGSPSSHPDSAPKIPCPKNLQPRFDISALPYPIKNN